MSSSTKRSKTGKDKDKKAGGSSKSKGKSGGLCSRTASLLAAGANEKSLEEVHKNLVSLKLSVAGDGTNEPVPAQAAAVAADAATCDFFLQSVINLAQLNADGKRDLVVLFNKLLKYPPIVEHLSTQRPLFVSLVESYGDSTLCLTVNLIFSEVIRYEPLVAVMLDTELFCPFYTLIQSENFDIATNAFNTFKELLTKHKAIVAIFLEKNYTKLFEDYTALLNSPNYVTKRTSLKLLGELLLDRSNFNVMTKYISEANNLKLMLLLLRDDSRNIQFEAFHVFKVFVANPKKPERILDLLVRNKERLVGYLADFHSDRGEDEQFMEERAYLIRQIQSL
eukprot:TRINITY_DN14503_c0_g1_i1.p1 TRINITY_DN14503_c0_g1~~TRINITY_DN14503_c0_g1_i1.p1  ORF type:complete len:337 (-),score=85.71 TRINITY_DN14503_c0_g1_i1:58-1068(-)